MKKPSLLSISIILVAAFASADPSFTVSAGPRAQATEPGLGTLGSYAVLGASAVTNTGATVLNGDLGISPGEAASVTGFPPGSFTGTLHAGDAAALQAQNDATDAYNALNIQPCNSNLTGQDLGGLTLTPGTYCFDSSSQLTGNLVLDALGDPNAVWIFRMGSTLTTASGSSVTYINSAQPLCNVYWQVGSSATLGTATQLMGNILAVASVTLNTGAGLLGRAVARTGAVTLDSNTITPVFCAAALTATPTNPDTPTATAIPASPTSTQTAMPVNTSTRTATLAPGVPTWTPTTTSASTNTSTPALGLGGSPLTPTTTLPDSTLLARVAGLPNSGGAPIRDESLPWSLMIAGGVGVMLLILGIWAFRRTHNPAR